MIGSLLHGERDRLDASHLAQLITLADARSLAHVERNAALQVGYPEGFLAIAAIGGADQVEQRIVLGDRHQLASAKCPAGRRKAAGEHADLANIGLTHRSYPLILRGEYALKGDDEVQHEKRLPVLMRLAAAKARDIFRG